jgi:hypothetical protein
MKKELEEKMWLLGEDHAQFMKKWYTDVFEHGFKHGVEECEKMKKEKENSK